MGKARAETHRANEFAHTRSVRQTLLQIDKGWELAQSISAEDATIRDSLDIGENLLLGYGLIGIGVLFGIIGAIEDKKD